MSLDIHCNLRRPSVFARRRRRIRGKANGVVIRGNCEGMRTAERKLVAFRHPGIREIASNCQNNNLVRFGNSVGEALHNEVSEPEQCTRGTEKERQA